VKRGLRRVLISVACAGLIVLASNLVAAPAQTTPTPEFSSAGVNGVTLGAKYRRLHRQNLIGKIRRGCPLGGPRSRSAPLVAPVQGSAELSLKTPRRVRNIGIIGGATARGVGIGSTLAQVQSAFPGASVNHETEQTFLFTLVKVPPGAGGRFEFAVDVQSGRVTLIGIPAVPLCE